MVKQISNEFQKNLNGKNISKYEIEFKFQDHLQLKSIKNIVTYSNNTKDVLDTLETSSTYKYINANKLSNQTGYIKARIKIAERESYIKKFENNCFSGYSGANHNLVSITKDAMHNPDSFEHVKTSYKVKNDYSIVEMTYRGKNKLNATVRNTTTAKIRLKDFEVLKVY